MRNTLIKDLPSLIQRYFSQYLIEQRDLSQESIAAYRDTFRLLLQFSKKKGFNLGKMTLDDLKPAFILAFLTSLEKERHNSIRTRNHRLAVIRSFLRYAALEVPQKMGIIKQNLSIPLKSVTKPMIQCLTKVEINAIIKAAPLDTWSGTRDQLLFTLMYNTGARVSEIIHIKVEDIDLKHSRSIILHGKGRKERTIPLWKSSVLLLKNWIKKMSLVSNDYLFSNHRGHLLTRSGVEFRLKQAVDSAKQSCQSLRKKKVTPHVI